MSRREDTYPPSCFSYERKYMNKIYLLAGVPASGKTWVCSQLSYKYLVIPHDDYIGENYIEAIIVANKKSEKPILIETPFSVKTYVETFDALGYSIEVVYIVEDEEELKTRYHKRDGQLMDKGHVTRNHTYRQRAITELAFHGTSKQVLEYLRNV